MIPVSRVLNGLATNCEALEMRIVIGGITHESNTFNPLLTRDFGILRGEELLKYFTDAPSSDTKSLLASGVEVIPTIQASAFGMGGAVEKDAFLHVKKELLELIEDVGSVDGVCLFLHGAMIVDGIGDGDNDLVKGVREIVGPDVLISVSLDLHANISSEMLDFADILTAYRTAPHIDAVETRERAFSLLVNCIEKKMKPVPVMVKPPMLSPADMAITAVEPASGLYGKLQEINRSPCILDSSLLMGYPWADAHHTGSGIIVIAEGEKCREEAYVKACELARGLWEKRDEFRLEVPSGSIDEMIRMAESSTEKPVFISDSGDNVTSSAAGDIPLFVERLLSLDVADAVVGAIADPAAVSLCEEAGIGNSLVVEIGGKIDTANGYPLEVKGEVIGLFEHGAVLRTGGVDVILTKQRTSFTTLDSFESFGIDPVNRKTVVVKLGYLFPELKEIAALSLIALSPGFANQDFSGLVYKNVRRPIFPLDEDFSWEPPTYCNVSSI